MEKVIKTAIAIPKVQFKKIESLRTQMRITRSQLLMNAFQEWLDHREKSAMEQRYVEGYKRHPESLSEITPLLEAGRAVWEKETWE
jgi:hypothetical protein